VELRATKVLHLGKCDGGAYPMAKKKHGMEFLREKAHLRPRTNVIGAVARIRNALAFATHTFFQGHGFLYVHTPIITASDCEGAGEMFQVTTLLGAVESGTLHKQPTASQCAPGRRDMRSGGGEGMGVGILLGRCASRAWASVPAARIAAAWRGILRAAVTPGAALLGLGA